MASTYSPAEIDRRTIERLEAIARQRDLTFTETLQLDAARARIGTTLYWSECLQRYVTIPED